MKNDFYNTQSSNNKYCIRRNSIEYNFTIPVGNYNVLQLLEILNTQLNTISIAVTYEEKLNKYKFTNGNTDDVILKLKKVSVTV